MMRAAINYRKEKKAHRERTRELRRNGWRCPDLCIAPHRWWEKY